MKSIKDVSLDGKRAFIRVDFNVPMDKDRNITDDTRIRSVLSTLEYALERNAKILLASHLGRPKGQPVPEFSLSPVARYLGEMLGKRVGMAPDCVGPDVEKMVSEMKNGDIILLENLRYHKEEQENDDGFAKKLASLCDVYVNNAFAVSHRVNASVAAITKYAPVSVAGMLLQDELDYFDKAMTSPERPLVAIVGGAKVSSKLAALENMLLKVDKVIIGGAMANTFLKAKGFEVGKSLVEDDLVGAASSVMKTAEDKGIALFIPEDAVIADTLDQNAETSVCSAGDVPADKMILDIGPETCRIYGDALKNAGTIVWNGPMGAFETEAFSSGTMAMVDNVANSDALTIVGGGDTDVAVHKGGRADDMSFISTGGGAFLKLLEGKVLPAVAALNEAG